VNRVNVSSRCDGDLLQSSSVSPLRGRVDGLTKASHVLAEMNLSDEQTLADFREQCRRQMDRPLELRIKYGFCRTYKPVLDDAPWRAFDSMAEYRKWCEANLPDYLGFRRVA
jgi:hypothetical protein